MKGCLRLASLFCLCTLLLPGAVGAQCYDLDTGELLQGTLAEESIDSLEGLAFAKVRCGCKTPAAPEGCTVAATTSNCSPHSSGEGCNGQCNFQQTCQDPDDNATITKDCKDINRPKPAPTPQQGVGGQATN